MGTYTTEEINSLETNLEMMRRSKAEVKLSDLNKEDLVEIKELYDIIVGRYVNATNGPEDKAYDGVIFPELKDLTEKDLKSILNTLEKAATGLVIIAKSRRA